MTSYTDNEIISILEKEGNKKAAAKSIGWSRTTFRRRVDRILQSAANVPDGHILKGLSTLQDGHGNIKLRWVKTNADEEKSKAALNEIFKGFCDDLPREKSVFFNPTGIDSNIINQYTITDLHLGMMAWKEETGADWDLKQAEELVYNWLSKAILLSPASDKCILVLLGDTVHFDGLDAVTPTARNILDSDSRFPKIVRAAIRIIRRIIATLLEKHNSVHMIIATGNHDLASTVWLRELFAVFYENEDRVCVDQSSDSFYCYEFGQTSLFYNHGHNRKIANITEVFAAKFREVFGRTKHSYGHIGHLHKNVVLENNLMIIEQHSTLAAADAYAAHHGWISNRNAKVITYHIKYGKVGEIVISPEMCSVVNNLVESKVFRE